MCADRPIPCVRLSALLQARNAALRREKELMARHYAQLKAALDRGRAAAAERLKQLSVMSGTAMQVGAGPLLVMALTALQVHMLLLM